MVLCILFLLIFWGDYAQGKKLTASEWNGYHGKGTVQTTDPTNKNNELYLFGHSAGAQVVHRFALWKPDICKAIAVHAPGGATLPEYWIPVKFLITVGKDDTVETKRRMRARLLAHRCKKLGISVTFEEYPGIKHSLTEDQIEQSLNFFVEIKCKK